MPSCVTMGGSHSTRGSRQAMQRLRRRRTAARGSARTPDQSLVSREAAGCRNQRSIRGGVGRKGRGEGGRKREEREDQGGLRGSWTTSDLLPPFTSLPSLSAPLLLSSAPPLCHCTLTLQLSALFPPSLCSFDHRHFLLRLSLPLLPRCPLSLCHHRCAGRLARPSLSPSLSMSLLDGAEEVLSLDDIEQSSSSSLLSSSPSLRHLTLLSKDHQSFSLSKEAAASSDLLKTMMEGDVDASEVQLFHIESSIVRRVIDYLEYHRTVPPRAIEKPIVSTQMVELVDHWDAAYIDVEQEVLFALLLAANYLHVKSLIALCCAKLASLLKNQTPEQIKATLGIKGDVTAQEEADIAKEYKDLIG